MFLLVCGGIAVYLLPTAVAMLRRIRNQMGVFLLNFLLGWTFLGWVGALIWAVVESPEG
ncbi:MAG: superinfection immunity protein [Alphaproteobacteria bacterium]|nr:superinfection immunity protein [Alphaproteobacteria bacterium]MBL6939425.1 superinfection immunity protein [Alphaproteobacteria bacterium]MBL7097094.1 superinfection immunity protein [Alphaproteobacteria bacterium]